MVTEYGGHCVSVFSPSGEKRFDHLALLEMERESLAYPTWSGSG